MPSSVSSKLKVAGFTAMAFAGGILLASGLDLTAGTQAATLLQTAPTPREVRPVADLSQAFISIAESVTPAVVAIETERTARAGVRGNNIPEELRELFPQFRLPEGGEGVPQESRGSGFIISDDGYIITNNHVVQGAEEIRVVLQDNRHLVAKLVGRDPNTDIAVVKVEGSGRLPTVRMGRSEDARIGEWVLAIGNPLDLGTTVTSGIVSAKGRALPILRQTSGSAWSIEDFIQTDAPINPGNSGGPLVNLRGEVVGVNSAIASPTGYYSGYGFAVPMDLARRIADDLIRYGKVRRPALGVSVRVVTPEDAEVFKLPRIEGVVAQDFPPQSPAREAGVRQGDVIVSVNGQRVERVGQFQRYIAQYRPGEEVSLEVVRYGDRRQFRVRLIEAQTEEAATRTAQAERPEEPRQARASSGKLGVEVSLLTPQLAQEYGYEQSTRGVVITSVEPYGVAARQGVQEGMRVLAVDGQRVSDVAEFRRLMERKRPGEIVSLVLGYGAESEGILNVRLPE